MSRKNGTRLGQKLVGDRMWGPKTCWNWDFGNMPFIHGTVLEDDKHVHNKRMYLIRIIIFLE